MYTLARNTTRIICPKTQKGLKFKWKATNPITEAWGVWALLSWVISASFGFGQPYRRGQGQEGPETRTVGVGTIIVKE